MADIENEEVLDTPDELATLKARADLLGISYHPSIGLEKLKEKLANALASPKEDNKSADEPTETQPRETEGQRRKRLKDAASALVRIRLTCMNPNKREWDGEIFTVGNAIVGTLKKYVPFNAPDGWHVPHMIYEALLHRECPVFYTVKDARGQSVRRSRLIKEFAIEVLPPLTQDELDELARHQAMAKAID